MNLHSIDIPNDKNVLGLLGYIVVTNKQIHSYQIDVIQEYLAHHGLQIDQTIISDILDGKETSFTYYDVLQRYMQEPRNVQDSLYYLLAFLSYVDNEDNTDEYEILKEIRQRMLSKPTDDEMDKIHLLAKTRANDYRNRRNEVFPAPQFNQKQSFLLRIWKWILKIVYFIIGKNYDFIEFDEEHLQKYMDSIRKSSVIAKEDFAFLEPEYEAIIKAGMECDSKLDSLMASLDKKTEGKEDIKTILAKHSEFIKNIVLAENQKVKESLLQKKRTVSDFTISLIGRTKAGKSTLHSILTKQGADKIGKGRQRTTRYNRVYQWNLLRIIDTPGIGSAEAEGRADDAIARSVLGESDLVCFLVVDDSVLDDVLELIESVSKLNKPIIVLLNHKDNITVDFKFKEFLKKPKDWLFTKGETNLKGYTDRIKEISDSKGFGHLIQIFPVFLLPAQMSLEEKYAPYKKRLWEGSNINRFIGQLNHWILSSGSIKRSQTILDESVQNFRANRSLLASANDQLVALSNRLENDAQTTSKRVEEKRDKVLKKIEHILKNHGNRLKDTHIPDFVDKVVYQAKYNPKKIGDSWNAYLKDIEFSEKLRTEVEYELDAFVEELKQTIQELLEDLSIFLENLKKDLNVNIDLDLEFDFKLMLKIMSALISLALPFILTGWGWLAGGTGIVLSFLANLFKSKSEKMKDRKDKLTQELEEAIEKGLPDSIRKTLDEIRDKIDGEISKIRENLDSVVHGIRGVTSQTEELIRRYDEGIEHIDYMYAWRIVQFLHDRSGNQNAHLPKTEIVGVDRSDEKRIVIECLSMNLDSSILRDVLAEEIIIKRGERNE